MVTFEVSEKGDCLCLDIGGELSIYSAEIFFNEHIKSLVLDKSLIIELKGVQEIDTAGIQILMMLIKMAVEKELEYTVVSLSEPVERYLALFRLREKFHIDLM